MLARAAGDRAGGGVGGCSGGAGGFLYSEFRGLRELYRHIA